MEFIRQEYFTLYLTFAAFSVFYGLYGVAFARYHQFNKQTVDLEDANSGFYSFAKAMIPVYGLLCRIANYAAMIYATIFVSWQVGLTLFFIGFVSAALLGGLLIGILSSILSNRATILLSSIPMLYFFYMTIVSLRTLE